MHILGGLVRKLFSPVKAGMRKLTKSDEPSTESSQLYVPPGYRRESSTTKKEPSKRKDVPKAPAEPRTGVLSRLRPERSPMPHSVAITVSGDEPSNKGGMSPESAEDSAPATESDEVTELIPTKTKRKWKKAKPAKEPKPPRYSLTTKEPTKGFKGIIWRSGGSRFYCRFGWKWLVTPTWRERLDNAFKRAWELRGNAPRIFVCANSGGGSGKTSWASWLTVMGGLMLGRVGAIDVNENFGFLASRLGIGAKAEEKEVFEEVEPEEPTRKRWLGKLLDLVFRQSEPDSKPMQMLNGVGTIRLREFVEHREEFRKFPMLLEHVDQHEESKAFVIASNKVLENQFDPKELEEAVEIYFSHQRALFADLGNGLLSTNNNVLIHMGHVLSFVCTPGPAGKDETEETLLSTMQHYAKRGHAEKVRDSFVVIFGAGRKKRKEISEKTQIPLERVIAIPFNKYMKRTANPISIFALPHKIQAIIAEYIVAMLEAPSSREDGGTNGKLDAKSSQQLKDGGVVSETPDTAAILS